MKIIYTIFISAVCLVVSTNYTQAQSHKDCGTTEKLLELQKKFPDIIQKQEELERFTQNFIKTQKNNKANPTYIIPVVFHILHEYGSENISDAQVYDQIRILNEDYSKKNPDTSAIIADFNYDSIVATCNIEFRLATKDPYGNCTNGIDRIYSSKTNDADDFSKINYWNRSNYLNVWVVKSIGKSGVAGYAYYPSAVASNYNIDGILILHNYIGSIGTSSPYSSRALTHEIGHYLNLAHPWGSTNDPEVACGDDGVADTPETKGSSNCSNLYKAECTDFSIIKPYVFTDVTTTTGTIDPTVITPEIGLGFTSFSASGVSSNPIDSGRFSFSNWDLGAVDQDTTYANLTGSINTSKYYEVTVSPESGYVMSLNNLFFKIQRSSTGARTFAVRSSADNFAKNIKASILNPTLNYNISVRSDSVFYFNNDTTNINDTCVISFIGTNYTKIKSPLTIRIYAWNAEDANGTFSLDSISVNATSSVIENVQNYMDYSYCSKMYTVGQKDRMHAALNSPISDRNNLWQPSNLVLTGTDTVNPSYKCAPIADFHSKYQFICQGNSNDFYSDSWNSPITGNHWEANGATPTTSNVANPTFTFNNLYWQTISLTSYNSNNDSGSVTKYNHVFVSPPWTDYYGTFSEGFENASIFNSQWLSVTNNINLSKWQRTNSASYTGSNCLLLNAYSDEIVTPTAIIHRIGKNDVDALISPSFDLSSLTSGVLNFKYAYGTRANNSADITEVLKIYVSTNCGKSWLPIHTIQGSSLVTTGLETTPFFPSNSNEWVNKSINLNPTITKKPNVRFKIEYTSSYYSNNLFIDDINITGIVGIDENEINSTISIYPNPFNNNTTISYTLAKTENINIKIYDLIGNEIVSILNKNELQGEHKLTFNKNNLPAGVYLLKLSSPSENITKKIVIQ